MPGAGAIHLICFADPAVTAKPIAERRVRAVSGPATFGFGTAIADVQPAGIEVANEPNHDFCDDTLNSKMRGEQRFKLRASGNHTVDISDI